VAAPPSSTYRLQLTANFDLEQAASVCRYLQTLGVGAVYLSPVLQSTAGSEHGYDVTDHDRIDVARGGAPGWRSLIAAAKAHDLGVVVDIVPNHMGVADTAANKQWWDVLRLGVDSRFSQWFDIEWSSGRVKLPVLGDGVDLEHDLTVDGRELRYAEHRFPIAPGTEPRPGESAAAVHDRQHYELVNFRRADTEQNYRRFFAVTTLAGLRVEDEQVALVTHREILRWVSDDEISGLRVDHPDGLADPGAYLDWLRDQAPDTWITVEKILEPGEVLPTGWPVAGTTGYDGLTEVNAVFVDPAGEPAATQNYQQATGDTRSSADHVRVGKRFIASTILRAEINRIARLVPEIADSPTAFVELAAAFPTYRSYQPGGGEWLIETIAMVTAEHPELESALAALLPRLTDPHDELCVRFQQLTGAVMAKGVEDTAYYRYTRFVALNEVGGDPGQFGSTVEEFHAAQTTRQARAPHSMTTLSTHDTKRGEDVRARLAVLAELAAEWAAVERRLMMAAPLPNPRFAHLLWQTFAGAGFIDRDRMHGYAEKAMREAREETGWIDHNVTYEAAVHAAVDAAYDDPRLRDPLEGLLSAIEAPARSNSLAQKLVQLTQPGVPDTYGGTELWEDSLVDPDNRRPFDFELRAALLADLDAAATPPPIDNSGAAKLWLVSRVLRVRRARPEWFATYRPLLANGPAADHALAFDRGGAITVAARLPVGLERRGGFGDTVLDLDGDYTDTLTGTHHSGRTRLTDLTRTYPVALLAPA
jgi:(1->4)-alpha-D-glucan 1-alpha-D-glucosylmutase